MHGSKRVWTTAVVGILLVVIAVLLERPEPLVGATAIAAWLLATQLLAVRGFEQSAALDVTYTTDRRRVTVEQPIRCRLVVERAASNSTAIEARGPVPFVAQGVSRADRTVTLTPDETRAATTFELTFPVAGRFAFDQPELHLSDALGLFSKTLSIGSTPNVDVSAQGPRNLHIGRGGERTIATYGDHTTDRRGPGLLPEELREYLTGDPAGSIDWKATARLNQPYVRQYRAETDRETVLIVDHRAAMDYGYGGETMLAYARAAALTIAESTISLSDPLGVYAVGDAGLTARRPPSIAPGEYTKIKTLLQALDATAPVTSSPDATDPGRRRRIAETLASEDSTYARSLRPFLESGDAYVQRLAGDPLFGAVQEATAAAGSNQWTVIITDDHDPTRLRTAVKLAERRSTAVLVFVTPRVLFEHNDDLAAAYERYVEFEDLRRELNRLPHVSAFEVGPGDRLQRLLAPRRTRTTGT